MRPSLDLLDNECLLQLPELPDLTMFSPSCGVCGDEFGASMLTNRLKLYYKIHPDPIRIVEVSQRLGHTMWVGILVSNSSTPLRETRAQTPNPGEAPHRQGAPIVGAAGCKQGDFGSSGGVLRVWALKP